MAKIRIHTLEVDELIGFIRNKKIAIPEFQREFVWTEKKVKELFDSLIRHYPIGSFIVWKTSKRIEQRSLFVKETNSHEKYLVLDGQQRMLSIYYLCRQDIFNQMRDYFEEVCETFVDFSRFYYDRSKRKPKLNSSKEIKDQFDYEDFKRKLRGYKIPVIVVEVDEYEKAIAIFEKINQSGTKISTEAIFLSEAWNSKTNLGKLLREWKYNNKNKLSSRLDSILFIHALAIAIQMEEKLGEFDSEDVDVTQRQLKKIAKIIKNEKTAKYEGYLKKVIKSMEGAMGFLREQFEIQNINELPSQTMLTILCIFFYHLNRTYPSATQVNELRKWFWRSALDGRYVGSGYNINLRKDPIKMYRLAKKSALLRIKPYVVVYDEMKDIEIHAGRSSLKNAIKLMLWMKKPIWITGARLEKGDLETTKRKKEDDHFYAYDFSRKDIISENEINSMLNIIFLPKTFNCSKQKELPSVWLKKIKKEQINKEKNVIKEKDEKRFFDRLLLPFDSIKDLEKYEADLVYRDGCIKKNKLNEHYQNFLEKRFELFKKELNNLQEC